MDGWRAFRRKSKMANVDVVREEATVGPRSPIVYDWYDLNVTFTLTPCSLHQTDDDPYTNTTYWIPRQTYHSSRKKEDKNT